MPGTTNTRDRSFRKARFLTARVGELTWTRCTHPISCGTLFRGLAPRPSAKHAPVSVTPRANSRAAQGETGSLA